MKKKGVKKKSVKHICHNCVSEFYLSNEISNTGSEEICRFCGETDQCCTFEYLVGRIEKVILEHYELTSNEPSNWDYMLLKDDESDFEWERKGQTVKSIIKNEFDIDENVAEEITNLLADKYSDWDADLTGAESDFSSEAKYILKPISDESWTKEWEIFLQILKYETRFFSPQVTKFLDSIFDGIEYFKTVGDKSVLTTIGPDQDIKCLFRARVFQNRGKLLDALCYPDERLGTPSSIFAMNGRMNARGISVFYGASDEKIALAEVRPPVGSKVAVAKFDLISSLQLLDLRGLGQVHEVVSVFDPEYLTKMEKVFFLRRLGYRMTKPVMPDDEIFDYIPTQVIADYLATKNDINIDGIIYPSVQVEGDQVNIALFHKSAKIDTIDYSPGISATDTEYDDDGAHEYYTVYEEVVPRKEKSQKANEREENTIIDTRKPTLQIDVDSIVIHSIKSVEYITSEMPVSWVKIKKEDKLKFSKNTYNFK